MIVFWKNPGLSLGERCVAFAENEMKYGVKEDKPGSFTSVRIREYFSICTRIINGKETPIGKTFTAGNWCAAAVSFSLYNSLLADETPPHGYRLGVVEIVYDLQKNKKYRSLAEVKLGTYKPKIGDPVIFDRSNPKDPNTTWWRHIGLVYSVSDAGFECISGNSVGGKWAVSKHSFYDNKLLGFGDYPSLVRIVEETKPHIVSDEENKEAILKIEEKYVGTIKNKKDIAKDKNLFDYILKLLRLLFDRLFKS